MSKSIEVRVPDIGDFTDVPVIEVLVKAGDRVNAEDSLITLESDKATMEVPSPESGVVSEVRVNVDDAVSEGDVVVVLDTDTETDSTDQSSGDSTENQNESDSKPSEESQPEPDSAAESDSSSITPGGTAAAPPISPRQSEEPANDAAPVARGVAAVDPSSVPYASPSVRKYARELGVNLAQVKGSGSGGRIVQDDVTAHVKKAMTSPPAEVPATDSPFNLPPAPKIDFTRFGEIEEQPLSRIRKLAGGHLHRNWVGIPHVTQHDEADITDMESFRKSNAAEAERQGFKLTPLVFLIKASVAAMKKYPQFNASLDSKGENLILKKYFNIGIAVDTDDGLVVPVLRDCDRKGIMQLARELGEISARAREKKLKPADIQGGCFSISSLGGIGGTAFTPIINAPEVAILGVSRSRMTPQWDGTEFQPRLTLPLSLSYDHRVIDGADGARFTRYLAGCLEDLRRLTL